MTVIKALFKLNGEENILEGVAFLLRSSIFTSRKSIAYIFSVSGTKTIKYFNPVQIALHKLVLFNNIMIDVKPQNFYQWCKINAELKIWKKKTIF